jgi:hypothetical protein
LDGHRAPSVSVAFLPNGWRAASAVGGRADCLIPAVALAPAYRVSVIAFDRVAARDARGPRPPSR